MVTAHRKKTTSVAPISLIVLRIVMLLKLLRLLEKEENGRNNRTKNLKPHLCMAPTMADNFCQTCPDVVPALFQAGR